MLLDGCFSTDASRQLLDEHLGIVASWHPWFLAARSLTKDKKIKKKEGGRKNYDFSMYKKNCSVTFLVISIAFTTITLRFLEEQFR